jgi:hypothetical protein
MAEFAGTFTVTRIVCGVTTAAAAAAAIAGAIAAEIAAVTAAETPLLLLPLAADIPPPVLITVDPPDCGGNGRILNCGDE